MSGSAAREGFGSGVAPSSRRSRVLAVAAALVVVVAAAFAPALRNEFVSFDDDPNLVRNLQIQQGPTAANLRWAFTTMVSENWHPLTWISHMIDFRFFGLWAGGHHAVSALVHAANAALLFAVLRALTGRFWLSALVAALFGLHPLRVESVAWAAERKDVLCVFFGLLALGAYLRYVRRRTVGSAAAALVLFACSLMSKAMLVTFPALVLLLDFWPLNRWSRARGAIPFPGPWLLAEKVPLLALSAAASYLAYRAQEAGGSVGYFFPLSQRIGNAFTSWVAYIGKTLWPAKLAVFYPYYWSEVPLWKPVLAAIFLAAVTVAVVLSSRRRPWWLVGWAWYAGTLVPVIGLVQVGSQSMADRYTYFPQIGVLLLGVWGLDELTQVWPRGKRALLALVPVVLTALLVATWVQVAVWRTSITLFSHAARVTEKNFIAYSHLGRVLVDQGRVTEGSEYLSLSYRVAPGFRADIFESAGDYYASIGLKREAAEHYRKALAVNPKRHVQAKLQALGDVASLPASGQAPDPHRGRTPGSELARGNLLVSMGRREEAAAAFRAAVAAEPRNAAAWNNLGCVLGELGRFEEAATAFERTLALAPDHPTARKNLEQIPPGRRRGGS